jgi:hypothetical protein
MDEPTTRATVLDREGPSRCGVARHQPVLSALEGRNDTGRVDLSPVSEGLTYPAVRAPSFYTIASSPVPYAFGRWLAHHQALPLSLLHHCNDAGSKRLGQSWPGIDDFGQIGSRFQGSEGKGKGWAASSHGVTS